MLTVSLSRVSKKTLTVNDAVKEKAYLKLLDKFWHITLFFMWRLKACKVY